MPNVYDQGGYPAGVSNADFCTGGPPLIIQPKPAPSAFHDAFAETSWKGDLFTDPKGQFVLELDKRLPGVGHPDDAAILALENLLGYVKARRARHRAAELE